MGKILKDERGNISHFEFADFSFVKKDNVIVVDMGDAYNDNNAQSIIENAKKMALEESELIKQKAYEEGYRAGLENGKKKAKELLNDNIKKHEETFSDTIVKLNRIIDELNGNYKDLQDSITDVVISITEKVIAKKLEEDESIIFNIVKDALNESFVKDIVLRVNPKDAEILENKLDSLSEDKHVKLIEDSSLTRGSAVIEEGNGNIIDASLSSKIDQIKNAINNG